VIIATNPKTCSIQNAKDVVTARQIAKGITCTLGFKLVDQTKIITAASELARNTLNYGKGGEMIAEEVSNGIQKGIRMIFTDRGPGIEDIEKALTDGFTTGGGLGLGLSGSKRLMSEFAIESEVGKGTKVTVTKWK
jgi:serine/threonine-protein kinase RsbT